MPPGDRPTSPGTSWTLRKRNVGSGRFADDASIRQALGRAVDLVGVVAVVGLAAELEVLDRGLPAHRPGLVVMVVLEAAARGAAVAVARDEAAAAGVPIPDRPPDRRRNVAVRPGGGTSRAIARPVGGGELPALEFFQERGEGSIEDLGIVSL